MSTNSQGNGASPRTLSETNYRIFFLTLGVIAVMIFETTLVRVADLFVTSFVYDINLIVFILISITFGLGQFIFLRFLSKKLGTLKTKRKLPIIVHKAVIAIQYGLTAILGLLVLQLISTSQYTIVTVAVALTISYLLGSVMMLILAKYFLSWYKVNKDLLMLLYGISAIVLAVHLLFTVLFVDYVFSGLPATMRTPYSSPPFFPPDSLQSMFSKIYTITSIAAFVTTWVATAVLLHHYSQKLGMIRFWILIALPLIYFLSQFATFFFNLLDPLIKADPLFFGTLLVIIFSLSKPAGGVLFGIAFWSVARRIRRPAAVRNYLIICAYGFVLLFTSDQGNVLINVPYPPFGIATISFMGLSTYLILNGISYSAAAVSQDTKLRRDIKESRLLDSIGSAQYEQEMRDKLATINRYQNEIAKRTGIQASLDEDEAKDYLTEVLRETKLHEKKESKDEDKPT